MSDRSKRKILNRLKNNVTREEPTSSSSGSVFLDTSNRALPELFEEQLKKVSGNFIPCKNEKEFASKLEKYLQTRNPTLICCMENEIEALLPNTLHWSGNITENTELAITGCEYLIAQTGSALVSTQQTHSRRTFASASIHAIVAFKNQLVPDLNEAFNLMEQKYKSDLPSQITTITGPSRTADIEKTLVLGVHGPKELIIFYIDVETE